VQGTYSQDWLLYDTDFNWRILRKDNGPLRAVGDIGSHWMDMIQHVTGLPITALCADLAIIHKRANSPWWRSKLSLARRCSPPIIRRSRSTPRTTAGCCSIWASARAARSR